MGRLKPHHAGKRLTVDRSKRGARGRIFQEFEYGHLRRLNERRWQAHFLFDGLAETATGVHRNEVRKRFGRFNAQSRSRAHVLRNVEAELAAELCAKR